MDGAQYCACEAESHGDLGPVSDDERLARLVTSPNHFRKDGGLKPGVFPLSHIKSSGLSLMRVDHMQEVAITDISHKIARQKEGESPSGLLIRSALELRSLRDEVEDRLLCVVDDPVLDAPPFPDNPAHAIAVSAKERSDEEILEIQSTLFELFDGAIVSLGMVHE
ncbi:hypothetical protein [Rhizobium ecuadorense]|uniref:hypothetical protein n=1 Tax=Rhizobium ecuadorense TaxID=1671795 RepID=UPI00067371A8|nr:hypothetical protein [Rhizobium ecuadorense]